jgi:hypothetical protein
MMGDSSMCEKKVFELKLKAIGFLIRNERGRIHLLTGWAIKNDATGRKKNGW